MQNYLVCFSVLWLGGMKPTLPPRVESTNLLQTEKDAIVPKHWVKRENQVWRKEEKKLEEIRKRNETKRNKMFEDKKRVKKRKKLIRLD